MPKSPLHERASFWVAFAGIPLVIGGICIAIGVDQVGAKPKADLWQNAWFLGGVSGVALGILFAWWGLTLFVAHRHAENHWCPDPQAHPSNIPARVVPTTRQAPLQPRYEQREPYLHRLEDMLMSEHHIGIHNPTENQTATGVRLQWIEMFPRPRIDTGHPPEIPRAVPMLGGGEATIGISLPPGRQELWVIGSTGTGGDGVMRVGVFSPDVWPWRGLPWQFEPNDRWRFTYRIVADNLPDAIFSVVMTAVDGHIRCDLEG
jgi:hypothetical protein